MVTFFAQVLVVVLGLGAGAAWPRRAEVVSRDTLVNLATGALLYPVRMGFSWLGVVAGEGGLVPLGTFGHPVLQFLFVFLLLDFSRYWLHYAHHRVPLLWSFHRVHHSSPRLDATSGLRMHVVDFLQLTLLVWLLYGGIFDITAFEPWVLPAALVVGIVADGVEHANVEFKLDTWWRRAWFQVFNTPLFHAWHHTDEGRLCDGNYANALPLWDRLFGTDVTRPEPPRSFGLSGDQRLRDDPISLQLLRRD